MSEEVGGSNPELQKRIFFRTQILASIILGHIVPCTVIVCLSAVTGGDEMFACVLYREMWYFLPRNATEFRLDPLGAQLFQTP